MASTITLAYTAMCWLLILGMGYRMFKTKDIYEQLVCGVAIVPFLLRALQIR
jgi:hypothetical protein